MSTGDKQQRTDAIPFRASWYDGSVGQLGDQFDSAKGKTTGDLANIATNSNVGTVAIRMARPEKGDLIEAKLTLQATTPFVAPTLFRVYGCDFAADGITANLASTNTTRQALDWQKISGLTAPLTYGSQANLLINGMNLLPIIPKRGDANYNSDGFILVFEIICKGDPTDVNNGWFLYNYKVDCSVQLAAKI